MNESDIRTKRRIEAIKAAIADRGMTANEISDAIYMNRVSGNQYTRYLLDQGRVHIIDWRRNAHTLAAVYLWGAGESKPRPIPLTRVEENRNFRERIKKDPVRHALYLARLRARDRANKAAKTPQGWASALFVGMRVEASNA
jgi:hypothetical protein